MARMGFSLDLNIPIVFLKYLCESTGYTSTEYKTLIEALETTQENALDGLSYISLDDFIGYVDDLHSLILQEGLVIPLYE